MIKNIVIFLFFIFSSCNLYAKSTLIFGAVVKPYLPAQEKLHRDTAYQHLINELEKKSNLSIQFKGFDSDEALFTAMRHHEINLAYYCHYDHSVLEKEHLHPLAVVLTPKNGQLSDHYSSYIIAKKSNLTTLAALKNKTIGLNKEGMSLSGFVYPMTFFKQNHIDMKTYFSKIVYYQGVLEGFKALDNGAVDAIATWDDAYEGNLKGQKYTIIQTIPHLPNPPIVAGNDVSTTDVQTISNALLSLPSSVFEGLSFAGVEAYQPGFYDESIRLINDLKKAE